MCGIGGVAGARPSGEALRRMADAMIHRGPDGDGFLDATGPPGLAFRRLAIVDLAGGAQPMSNEDGSVHVVFNGEIYDHALLRRELERRGHRFSTDHSDTEVLVHGWEEWREELFARLNGMFAVAVWDANGRRLVLARDRFGIKPLYHSTLDGGGLVFASEIRAIHASGLVRQAPSARGIREYFAFQNVWGAQTMFENIRQLPPGTILTWHEGGSTERRYWDLSFPRRRGGPLAALAGEHREILERVVRRQIAADVPVVSYLSGGIDSTAITVASHRVDPAVTAYSCVFDLEGVGDDRFVDEREFSRSVAAEYGLARVEYVLEPEALPRSLRDYVRALEDLRMGMGYPVFLIARRVAEDARVVLSGTGGDELHAGYVGRYQSLGLTNGSLQRRPRRLRRLLARAAAGAGAPAGVAASYTAMLNFLVPEATAGEFFTESFLRDAGEFDPHAIVETIVGDCPSDDWRDRVMYVDAKTYLAGLLALEDKVSMAHSLETRVPLLDNELVDFLLDVPFDVLCRGETGKVVFRESVRPWVPDEIYAKPKMGFGPPDASWYRGPLRTWIEEALSEERIASRGVVRPDFVRTTLDDHFSGRRNMTYLIWSLLNFEAWCDEFGFYAE